MIGARIKARLEEPRSWVEVTVALALGTAAEMAGHALFFVPAQGFWRQWPLMLSFLVSALVQFCFEERRRVGAARASDQGEGHPQRDRAAELRLREEQARDRLGR